MSKLFESKENNKKYLRQYTEEDIQNYSQTVMFRGTPFM